MKESKNVEFKQSVTATFLKTVSAYANYEGGEILFGLNDEGVVVGVINPEQTKLDIENRINDSIFPTPDYELSITNAGRVVKLTVFSGQHKPYLYKSKAYRRNDTATIEVDGLELRRLILAGTNTSFEETPSEKEELKFSVLGKYLQDRLGIDTVSGDVLKSLGLYQKGKGYCVAAEILSDDNGFPGIDLVRFGTDINTILKRETIAHMSILSEIEKTVEIYEDYYVFERISGVARERQETIPGEAFREAIANALVHRTWDVDAGITVFMFEDRIEITSPGGLRDGISRDEFLRGGISVTRNRLLADILLRIGIIEKLGTGIPRIRAAYKESYTKPSFEIYDNSIKIILPCVSKEDLSQDELAVYRVMSKTAAMSTGEVTALVPFGKSKVLGILRTLCDKNIISREGRGRGIKYRIVP